MTIKLGSLLTTAALSLTVGLVGCSGDQPSAGTASSAPAASAPASPTETAPTEAAPTETAPTEAAPTEAASPTEESSTGGDTGGSSGRPAKAAIVAGLTAFYVKTQGLSPEKAKKFATCMVDELYDKASTTTLKGLLAGDPTKIDKGDAGLIAEAGNTCQSALS